MVGMLPFGTFERKAFLVACIAVARQQEHFPEKGARSMRLIGGRFRAVKRRVSAQ
jgi:hypothetical protein